MADYSRTTGKIPIYGEAKSTNKVEYTTQLFGLPYQFIPSVDQRVPGVSAKLGREYIQKIIVDSNVVTIIPGKPKYLPGVKKKDKAAWTNALIDSANSRFDSLKGLYAENTKEMRLYDFQSAYVDTYQYINILCRAAAAYMELDTPKGFTIGGKQVNFLNYDWKDYRWDGHSYKSMSRNLAEKGVKGFVTKIKQAKAKVTKGAKTAVAKLTGTSSGSQLSLDDPNSTSKEASLDKSENILKASNFIQFYTYADAASSQESLSNSTQQSSFKQMFDQGSSAMRDVTFLLNSGGVDGDSLGKLGDAALGAMDQAIVGDSVNTAIGGVLSRLLTAGRTVLKGENMIMPDIYGGSQNSKSYNLTFKFKALYGNRLSTYMDVIVPVMHCIALAYPRSTSANTYGSPPLLKIYLRGSWTANLAICTSIEISKDEVEEAWNEDGLCTEVTVTMGIQDLYSDMALTPANDPQLFINNVSLVEFLATNCGLDLVTPQYSKKAKVFFNQAINTVKEIPSTAIARMFENLDRAIMKYTGI